MPKLSENEVCRLIKPVDLASVLPLLGTLPFFRSGGSGKYPADVVVWATFPPELKRLVADLNLGGDLARAVLRRLAPRQSIPPHVDDWMPQEADWRRFQVPLVTDPRVIMRWPDRGIDVHLKAGHLYEVRFDVTHEVVNEADIERIHLQIDQVDATI